MISATLYKSPNWISLFELVEKYIGEVLKTSYPVITSGDIMYRMFCVPLLKPYFGIALGHHRLQGHLNLLSRAREISYRVKINKDDTGNEGQFPGRVRVKVYFLVG